MARKTKSYRVDTKKRVVIVYKNIKQTANDKYEIDLYLNSGYKLKAENKVTVEDMKKELQKDKEALAEFERLYDLNEENAALGFHRAMQFYTKWKKNKKAEKKEEKK